MSKRRRNASKRIIDNAKVGRARPHAITEKKTEETLLEDEAILKSFFESPGIMRGIVEVINETDVRHIQDNAVTASYIGLTPAGLQGKLSSELHEPAERVQLWLQYYKQSQTSGQPVRFEYMDKQGSKETWLQSTVSYLGVAKSGNPRFAYVVIDITERKQLEAKTEEYARHLEEIAKTKTGETQAERQRLYSVLETLPVMICLLTSDHYVVFANRAFRERFGESQGRHCYDYCFGNKEPCDFCESYKVLETGKPHHWEVPCPDGSVIDAHDFPFTDTDGSHLILEMDIDITEQKRLHRSLRSASQYARSLIEASLDPLVTISAEGKITDVNEATIKVTGLGREEIIGTDFSDYFTEPEKAREGYLKVFTEGFVRDYPLAIKHKSGRITDVLYNATLFKDERDKTQGVFAAARDMTERKRSEEALRKQAALIDLSPDGIIVKNPDDTITFWSSGAEKLYGWTREEAIGKRASSLLKTPYPGPEEINFKQLKEAGNWSGEIIHETKDGRKITVQSFWRARLDQEAEVVEILESNIDVTQRKTVEETAHAASLYSRSLIEASLDPLVTINADGQITDVNKATEDVTGYSRDQLIGSDFSDYFTEPDKARTGYQKVFTEGFVRDYPLAIRHKFGKVTDVLYNATLFKNEAGKIQGVFAAARDVTEHYMLERRLKDVERLAAIGATAGMVGHDIRNPLQGIEGAIYLGNEASDRLSGSEEDKATVKEMFKAIEDQTKYINKIVSDLQDFARPLNPELVETPSQQLIKESLSNIELPENVEVSTVIEDGVADLKVDPELMRRVMVNLITNSLQAMPHGGKLTIRVFKKGGSACISVQDTGLGIPEYVKPNIFQPMFTTKSKGQGFGLAVCKRIVNAHNGEISFDSEVDKGTVFTMQIPFT